MRTTLGDEFTVSRPVRIQPQYRIHKLAPEQRTESHHSQIRRGENTWLKPRNTVRERLMNVQWFRRENEQPPREDAEVDVREPSA